MQQETCVKFSSEDKKIVVYCDGDTSLGSMHDILMKMKGHIIDRMTQVHKDETETSEEMKNKSECPSE